MNALGFTASWLLVAALVIGCGQSDREKYLSRADAVCRDATEDYVAKAKRPKGVPLHEAHKVGEAVLRRMKALTPPESIRTDVETYLEFNKQKLRAIEDQLDPESRVPERAWGAKVAELDRQTNASARRIGLQRCS